MKKLIVVAIIVGGLYYLLRRRISSMGVSAPTSYPTTLYTPSLIV